MPSFSFLCVVSLPLVMLLPLLILLLFVFNVLSSIRSKHKKTRQHRFGVVSCSFFHKFYILHPLIGQWNGDLLEWGQWNLMLTKVHSVINIKIGADLFRLEKFTRNVVMLSQKYVTPNTSRNIFVHFHGYDDKPSEMRELTSVYDDEYRQYMQISFGLGLRFCFASNCSYAYFTSSRKNRINSIDGD